MNSREQKITTLKEEIVNMNKIDACRHRKSSPEILTWKNKQINKRLQEIDKLNDPSKNPTVSKDFKGNWTIRYPGKNPIMSKSNDTPQV